MMACTSSRAKAMPRYSAATAAAAPASALDPTPSASWAPVGRKAFTTGTIPVTQAAATVAWSGPYLRNSRWTRASNSASATDTAANAQPNATSDGSATAADTA
jgi:hypothetical protein